MFARPANELYPSCRINLAFMRDVKYLLQLSTGCAIINDEEFQTNCRDNYKFPIRNDILTSTQRTIKYD